jgi:hypothetical protein
MSVYSANTIWSMIRMQYYHRKRQIRYISPTIDLKRQMLKKIPKIHELFVEDYKKCKNLQKTRVPKIALSQSLE